jgi:hypothetical protein
MKSDLLSEVVLVGSALMLLLILTFVIAAAVTPTSAIQ